LSVLITDEFMQALKLDQIWPLTFPTSNDPEAESPPRIITKVRARELWEKIMRTTYEIGEPGVLFIDRINNESNLQYATRIHATNPCGEIPLPPYGACDLGSFNLTQFVISPFSKDAFFDYAKLADITQTA